MLHRATAAPFAHQALSSQEIPDRAQRRPLPNSRVPWPQPLQQFVRTPGRMCSARLTEQDRDVLLNPMRTLVRRVAAVLQPCTPFLFKSLQPFVPGLPADPVPGTQLLHGVETAVVIRDELHTLPH